MNRPSDGAPYHLRLSVTDRCNLRCFYCMPPHGVPEVSHASLLTLEELALLADVIHEALGLSKIRITGGEPLVRKGVSALIPLLPPVPDIGLTTNGVLLCAMARELRAAGLSRVNVSLDSLSDSVLKRITRRELTLETVQEGIRCAIDAGLSPIKVNCVVLKGVNDSELGDMVEWGHRLGVHVRFIEHMPHSDGGVLPEIVLRDRIAALAGGEEPLGRNGTEETWVRPDGLRFGIIAPVSGHLCPTCRRVRLTAQGEFMPCLSGIGSVDLKPALRSGAPRKELGEVVLEATARKPERGFCQSLPMWRIGG